MPGPVQGLKRHALALAKGFYDHGRHHLLFDRKRGDLYGKLVAARELFAGAVLRVDVCTVCQLRCQECPTASGANRKGVVGWGMMSFDDFRRVVDQVPTLRLVELSNWGEILLNPDLPDIIQYAHRQDIKLKAGNGVNLNRISEETLEAMVRYRFDYLSVSLDGASSKTYSTYRRGGRFDRVIENIRRLNALKTKHGTDKPKLLWQYVVFGHNEHELPAARKMAEELGMKFRAKLNYAKDYSPVRDAEMVRRESGLGVSSREEFKRKHHRAYKRACMQLWDCPQINWDGKLLGCCANRFGHYGNVLEDGLHELLDSERYTYAKRMTLGLEPPRRDIPCSSCNAYWEMAGDRGDAWRREDFDQAWARGEPARLNT